MLSLPYPRGSAAEMDDTYAKQPPAEKPGSDSRDEVYDSCRELECWPGLEVTRDEVDASAGTLWARDDIEIVFVELLGRPDLDARPSKGKYMQSEGPANVRY